MILGVNSTYFQALSSILQPQLTILQKLRNSREKYIYRQVKIKIYFKFLQLRINGIGPKSKVYSHQKLDE